MPALFKQAAAIIKMNAASLPGRLWSATTTVFAVALTTLTLLTFLAMAAGFSRTVAGTGSKDVAIIMSAGARAELTSNMSVETIRLLLEAPGIAENEGGQSLMSAEALVVIEATKTAGGPAANISFRGVTPDAMSTRAEFAITQGRMFRPGSNEIIVGVGAGKEFAGFELGQERRLGGAAWEVVGLFEVGETVFDSEVWADLATVQSLFNRNGSVQALRLKLRSPNDISQVRTYADADPRLHVDVVSEQEYFAGQSRKLQLLIYFGWALALVLAIGALAGALNTMYAAVEERSHESATLRAIGFGRVPVFIAAMAEAIMLALTGAFLGSIAALVALNGVRTSTLGEGFTQVVFQLSVEPAQLIAGLLLALVLGGVGGLLPALRAATAPVRELGANSRSFR